MKRKILILLIIALAIFCLVSCGGGNSATGEISYSYGSVGGALKDIYGPEGNTLYIEQGRIKEGHHLVGFFTEDGLQYFDGEGRQLPGVLIEDEYLRLYGKEVPNDYTLKLNSENGAFEDGSTEKKISFTYGNSVSIPNAKHIDEKYELDGYFVGDTRYTNGTELIYNMASHSHGKEISLVAKYKVKELTVTLDYCDSAIPNKEIKVKYGEPIGNLSAYHLDKGNKEIAGWSAFSYAEANIPSVITKNTTIYAVWKEYRDVIFVGNDTEVTKRVYMTPGESSVLPTDVFPGYTTIGWYVNSVFSGNPISVEPYGALKDKYYGKLEKAIYDITFTTGTSEVINKIQYSYGDTLKLPIPQKENNIFLGWKLENDEALYLEINKDMWGNKHLTAIWKASTPISSASDLEKIRQNPSGTYHLTQDINFKFDIWTPIEEFSGTLDGQGYKISNMVLNGNVRHLAMFIDNSGAIKNLSFDNVSFKQTSTFYGTAGAILAAYNDGKIINCHLLSGKMEIFRTVIEADPNAGGWSSTSIGTVVGCNTGLISDCTSCIDIEGTVDIQSEMASNCIGGLVGIAYGTIEDCYTELSIKLYAVNGRSYNQFAVGGLIGTNFSGDLYCTRSNANCEISLDSSRASGGVFASFGGFIGRQKVGAITECCSEGSIYANSKSNGDGRFVPRVGGFVGFLETAATKITDCYSKTNVVASGMATELGGFAGNIVGEIENCVAYGEISNASGRTGTFAGFVASDGKLKSSFTTLTGAFHGGCDGIILNSANANDHTLEELKSPDFLFDTLYFDSEIWIADGENLPILAWQTENEE